MAVIDEYRDDNLERDPHLVRLVQAAGGEEPPDALNATILAAARREVHAGPLAAGGGVRPPAVAGSGAAAPVVQQKRNWYVAVSIAAVLVLSVSLVTLVHVEKGDELAQPPRSVKETATAPAPSAPPAAPVEASRESAAAAKPDSTMRDAAPVIKSRIEEAKRNEAPPPAAISESADAYAQKQHKRAEKLDAASDAAKALANALPTPPASVPSRNDAPPANRDGLQVGKLASVPATGASAGASAGTPAAAPAPVPERRPEPFPAVSERDAPALAPREVAPAAPGAEPARAKVEADRSVTRDSFQSAPASRPAPVASAARQASAADNGRATTAAQVDSRVMATPPPAPAAKPALKRGGPQQLARPVWFSELDNQPPEKWLERLAEFKRDGRRDDADELLVEFRRRFPDHPASAR